MTNIMMVTLLMSLDHAIFVGFVSYVQGGGSVYITELVNEFSQHSHEKDVNAMLESVNIVLLLNHAINSFQFINTITLYVFAIDYILIYQFTDQFASFEAKAKCLQ